VKTSFTIEESSGFLFKKLMNLISLFFFHNCFKRDFLKISMDKLKVVDAIDLWRIGNCKLKGGARLDVF